MGAGEAAFKKFSVFLEDRIPIVTDPGIPPLPQKCCFQLPVFADLTDSDPLKNDQSPFITWLGKEVATSNIYFEQYNLSTGNWDFLFIADFDNDDHGIWFPKWINTGDTNPAPAFNNLGVQATGYTVNWNAILTTYGEGTYRVNNQSAKTASPFISDTSPEFCLRQYSTLLANKTVRFEGQLTGYRKHLTEANKLVDFSPNVWNWQKRLPDSFFGIRTEELSKEYVEYDNRERIWIKDESIDKFIYISGFFPESLHNQLKDWYFKGDHILVTDYSNVNANTIILEGVVRSGPYDPKYALPNTLTKVEVDFESSFKTGDSKRC